MNSPRWRKLRRDIWTERGRILLMITAIAVSLAGIGAVLGAYSISSREMARNYLGTRPASAALELRSGVDQSLVDEVRRYPGIVEAEAADILVARAKVGADWKPLLLFVVEDFHALRLNTFTGQSGAWPPAEGTMLIERSAAQVLEATEGDSILVKTQHADPRLVPITGLVHDPGLAPAWQEATGYGYITRASLAQLGEPAILGELRVLVGEPSLDLRAIEAKAAELSRWLEARGHHVEQIRIPPPGKHPHQTQMYGVLFLMLAFSAMALVLSAILVATSIAALLARQIREIGVMKTLGARSSQLAALYGVLIVLMGSSAVLLALPAGVVGAQALSQMTARMLNLTLDSMAIPAWVFAVEAAAGIFVPLLVATVPIALGTRVTVRQALDRHGAAPPAPGRAWLSTSGLTGWLGRDLLLASRNVFRRRIRLGLTLGLLAAGGAMFLTALNTSSGWESIVNRVYETRSYDLEVRLNASAAVAERLRLIPGVRTVEAWGYSRSAISRSGEVDVVRTYPDGSHGSLALMGPPADTALVRLPLIAGRWLVPGDTDAVVLNHGALRQTPATRVGDQVTLSLDGRPTVWRVVGIVEEVGAAGVAYVTDGAFAQAAGSAGRVRMLRIDTDAESDSERADLIHAVEDLLAREHIHVEALIPLSILRTAMGDHVIVLIRLLLAMALLLLTVGLLGLASTMSTNVLERTREIGVLKTLGATPRQIARLVLAEGLLIAGMSWLLAVALAVPLSVLVGRIVGLLSFGIRLPLQAHWGGVAAWLGLVALVTLLATLLPARRASKLTVSRALAQL